MAGEDSGRGQKRPMPSVTRPGKVLSQERKFLDFFWDIAKPDQEIRLAAIEELLRYLQENQKDDEILKYTLKRLIDGLAATREAARPGFSLALAQVLQAFVAIPLIKVLEQIKEKHNLIKVKKKLFRNALFGNMFGVLSLFQSGRLPKDSKALLECVQLLQSLSEYRAHLKDLPRKTLADIVSEIPEAVFEDVLLSVLEDDLTSAFTTPEHLYLLLVGIQRFPSVLQPEKLKTLLGTASVVTEGNIPRLVELLKMAVKSEKKDRTLPSVGLDLMKVALAEGTFELFWKEAVENGLLKEKDGPSSYMCFRLLGSSLPLLSLSQLKMVLRGDVMLQFGTHIVSNQLPDRFKFAPEMEAYIGSFLEGCNNAKKQLAAMIGFSSVTNQGYPIMPSFWKVLKHLRSDVLLQYMDWLKDMFLHPDLDSCLDFATRRQKQNEKKTISETTEQSVTRLRKWIIARLAGIAESSQIKREEKFVMDITRFCFFHAFFDTKKPTSKIPETEAVLSVPLSEISRTTIANTFFSLLQHLSMLPALGDSAKAEEMRGKHIYGMSVSGDSWIHLVVCYATMLLSQKQSVQVVVPFNDEEQAAWDRMQRTVEDLHSKEKHDPSIKTMAFQQLLLLVGLHLFKSPTECVDLLNDLQNCIKRAFGDKPKRAKAADARDGEEPEWVEVTVEVLLSLLAQSSGLIRRVCNNVFGLICQHMTKNALQLILDVLDLQQDQDEESAVVVTEETQKRKSLPKERSRETTDKESSESSGEEGGEESDDEEKDDEEASDVDEVVDENFRSQLMNVLQAGNVLGGDDSAEELDDEAMMSLDKNLSALFAEQQKHIQAKKDEKEKMRKEKVLRREFKIKVLDLVLVFLNKQAESPLVFDVIDPLLSVIEQSMNSAPSPQEQDFLSKTANIFMNNLCRAKQYCKNVAPIQEALHDQLESLVKRACKQSDSSVALYCFSASLYLFRVLRGNPADEAAPRGAKLKKKLKNGAKKQASQLLAMGCLDLERVTTVYQEALNLFLSKRKSPLTGSMFLDLFQRHPVMCKQLVNTVVQSITTGARQHQQAQACLLLQKALQAQNFKLLLTDKEWKELIRESTSQVTKTLKVVEFKVKVDQEKVIRCLELLHCLIRIRTREKLEVNLEELCGVLQLLAQQKGFTKATRLDNIYWNVMQLLGFTQPAKAKMPSKPKNPTETQSLKQKKKGFLPATKKRKNRKNIPEQSQENGSKADTAESATATLAGKKRKRKRKSHKKDRAGAGHQGQASEEGTAGAKKLKLMPEGARKTAAKLGNLKKPKNNRKKMGGGGERQDPPSL